MRKLNAQVQDGFANTLVARLDARMRTLPVRQLAKLVVRKVKRAQLFHCLLVSREHGGKVLAQGKMSTPGQFI